MTRVQYKVDARVPTPRVHASWMPKKMCEIPSRLDRPTLDTVHDAIPAQSTRFDLQYYQEILL